MYLFFRLGRTLHWIVRLLLVVLILDLAYVAWIWPDWDKLARGAIPKTNFMRTYEEKRLEHADWPRLAWRPVPLSKIPRHVIRAVLLGEDSRFYTHSGFDLIAIREALDYNLAEGYVAFGASTISQQTAKNLFLTPARTPLRKWHETLLTWGLEHHLKKRRILEIYLNTAEFGRGIYGVEAASLAYWGVPAENLSVFEAAELAATLPGPTKHNPATRTAFFERRTRKILNLLAHEFDVGPGQGEAQTPISKPDEAPATEPQTPISKPDDAAPTEPSLI